MTASVSPADFERFARACQAAHEARALSSNRLKALHARFMARGADGSTWTVGLSTLKWHAARDGQWQAATPPAQLQVEEALLAELSGIEAALLSTVPTIDGGALRRLLQRTSPAIGGMDRGPLAGLLMTVDGGTLTCVASDGRRLVLASGAVAKAPAQRTEAIVPHDLVRQLIERLGLGAGPVALELGNGQARFAVAGEALAAAAVPGSFPDYRLMMPKAASHAVRLDRDAVAGAVRRIAPPDGELPRAVSLAARAGALTVADPAANRSEALPATVRGNGIAAIFESHYLLDALAAMDAGEVELASDSAIAPALLTHPGRDDVKIIVMPRRS